MMNWKPVYSFLSESFGENLHTHTHTHTYAAMQEDTVTLMWYQCTAPSDCATHGRLLSFHPHFQLNVENVTFRFVNGAFQGHSIFWKMKYSFIGEDSRRGSLSEIGIHGSSRHFFNIWWVIRAPSNAAHFFQLCILCSFLFFLLKVNYLEIQICIKTPLRVTTN